MSARLAVLHPYRWGALLLAVTLIGLWMLDRTPPALPAGTLQLIRAERVHSDATQYPDTLAARAVALPDAWRFNSRQDGPYWYRLRFDLPGGAAALSPQAPLLGAYVPQICADFEVQLNGQRLHSRGTATAPGSVARPTRCLEAALLTLPPALLKPTGNLLDVRLDAPLLTQVVTPERAGRLAPVTIAPLAALEPLLRRSVAYNLETTHALATLAGVIGLAALALAALSRLNYLVYFGSASLGWAALLALLSGASLPLSAAWTEVLLCALSQAVAVAGVLFLLRYCGLRLAWLETSLALQCLIVPLTLAVASLDRLNSVARPWQIIMVLEVAVTLCVFLRRAWQYSRADFWIATSALASFALTLLHELLMSPGPVLLPGKHAVSVGLAVMFAGMVWRMHQLFQNAIEVAEQARTEADQRAIDVSANMEQNYVQMAELRVEQVTTKERKRIAADLHDDLGAKLLTIVHTSENERIATLAREALEEMRLSVRGLTGRAMLLGDAIGDWRSEVMSRLSQGGVELAWNTPDELLMSERALSARAYVQTTRILREAVSNVLKHSGATRSEITIRQDLNDFELTISDNGKGIPTEMDGKLDRGHGMSTMKGRAKQLQGQCLVESGPGYGTTIRLTLPL